MKIWLDGIRPAPSGWIWCRTAVAAILVLITTSKVDHISFDYDLGVDSEDGVTVANFIENSAYNDKIDPITWEVHSQNSVGAQNIRVAMTQAEQFWDNNKHR